MNFKRLVWILRGMVDPDRVRAEVTEELASHIEMRTADNIAEGMSPQDARRAAERQFGPVAVIEAEGCAIRGGSTILRQASALAPIVMSLCALTAVIIHVARFGGAREVDEGSAAHVWQLMMALQVPVIFWFGAKWLPRAPERAFVVLLLQAVAALGDGAGVHPRPVDLSQLSMAEPPVARRLVRACVALAGVLALGVVTLLVALQLERRRGLTLPAPTGPFAVGRTIHDWVDPMGVDSLAPMPGAKRELLVWIWYPAVGVPGATDDYVPRDLRGNVAGGRAGLFALLTRDLDKVRDPTTRDAAVSPREKSYPVLILRAGASAAVLNYSTLAEDLASHGYVVVGFDAPYRTSRVVFPDGRTAVRAQINNPEMCVSSDYARQERCVARIARGWVADFRFALDRLDQLNRADSSGRFAGRLDLSRVGAFGHSLGGATAAQFCHDDARCRAAVDIDGALHGSVIADGMPKPFMFVLGGHGDTTGADARHVLGDIAELYGRLPRESRVRVVIPAAGHYLFSDDGALLKSGALRGLLRMLGQLGISGRRQLEVTAYCLRTFFDARFKAPNGSRPQLASPLYPEVHVMP